MKDDRLYLEHIRECIERIEAYTQSGQIQFMESTLIQDAVIRNFEIIGEAVKQISDETLDKIPEIPWRRIAGFRDVLIHGYMGIEMEEVWRVVEKNLPELKEAVEYLLR